MLSSIKIGIKNAWSHDMLQAFLLGELLNFFPANIRSPLIRTHR
jgi:hypothetical protein